MRWRRWKARTADTAPVEMIDEASRAHPGLKPASIHVCGPVAAAWSKRAIAHQRLSEQADQFLAIDGIHSPTIRRERSRNNRSRSSRCAGSGLATLLALVDDMANAHDDLKTLLPATGSEQIPRTQPASRAQREGPKAYQRMRIS